MDPLTGLGLLLTAAGAGLLGSMVGLGGGVFVVPIFSVFFGIPLKTAIAASAVSVVVNSSTGASVYLRHRMSNIRLALLMLITTTVGSIAGGLVAVGSSETILRFIFALTLYGMIVVMARRAARPVPPPSPNDALGLTADYDDPAINSRVCYTPRRLRPGMAISAGAGVISGMLGIGGGAVQVPAMNAIMEVPVKAAAATSTFMVGPTVVASALIFYLNDLIDPSVTAVAVVGMMLGAQTGARLARHIRSGVLTRVLMVILLYLATITVLQALGIHVPGAR
ncbi:MAG: sulfite exporter TauE/SafE family protein [Sphaerobacter sp.]|nr:sulfite exporter TauE/SafE family protein [Sphaerobacter sp.]